MTEIRPEIAAGDDTQQLQGRSNLKWGHVTEILPAEGRVRVELEDNDGIASPTLQVLQHKTHKDKHYWMPDQGEYVAFMLDENGEDGVVLGAFYSDIDAPPVDNPDKHHIYYDDGSYLEYDRGMSRLVFRSADGAFIRYESGLIHLKATQILLEADQTISLQAPVQCAMFLPGAQNCTIPPPAEPEAPSVSGEDEG